MILYAAYELARLSPLGASLARSRAAASRRAESSMLAALVGRAALVATGARAAIVGVAEAPLPEAPETLVPEAGVLTARPGEPAGTLVTATELSEAEAARTRREIITLSAVSVVAALIYYLPFVLRLPSIGGIPFNNQTMDRVYGMWDGPIFTTEAATLWDPNPHNPAYAWLGMAPSGYAEHFPLYPLAIRLVAPLFGYWNGGLFVNVVVSTAVTVLLYVFLRRFSSVPRAAFWIALFAIFLPPRAFFYRYVPMSEPLFTLGVLGAVYFFKTRRFTLSGLFGAIAVASRPNSFLFMGAVAVIALARLRGVPRRQWPAELGRMSGLLLMPLSLFAVSLLYKVRFGDWLAAVHSSTFVSPQFSLFPFLYFFHIGEEGTTYVFFLCLAGILELARRRHWDLALIAFVFWFPALFVNADVSRYLLPALPFAFALAGDRILSSWPLRIALILSIPLVFTYSWETMLDPGYQAPFASLRALLP